MVEPINFQIIVTTVDEVAKTKNVHEHSLIGQQLNAQKEEAKEIERKNQTIVEIQHAEKKIVNNEKEEKKEQEKRYILKESKKEIKENKDKPSEKGKDPNKGKILDIEI